MRTLGFKHLSTSKYCAHQCQAMRTSSRQHYSKTQQWPIYRAIIDVRARNQDRLTYRLLLLHRQRQRSMRLLYDKDVLHESRLLGVRDSSAPDGQTKGTL